MPAITSKAIPVPYEYSTEIIKGIEGRSKVFELGRRLPDMRGAQYDLPVISALTVAGFVDNSGATITDTDADGETVNTPEINRKPLSRLLWENKSVYAKEIAVIVPIAEATLDDLQNLGYEVIPTISADVEAAFANVIDGAVFFGTNSPFTALGVPSVVAGAKSAGAVVAWNGNGPDLYDAISDAMSFVETSGFEVTAIIGSPALRGAFRKMRDQVGQLIWGGEIQDLARYYNETGAWLNANAFAVVGDFRYLVYSIRQDMRVKLLDQATLTDPTTGSALYHLGQQDMVALRFTMRFGYQLPNPVNRVGLSIEEDGVQAFPFAVITKGNAGSGSAQ